jgi:hypothetical protein
VTDLDAARRHLDLSGREPVFRLFGGVEVVEQRRQRGDLGAGGEVGHDVGERVEVGAADGPGDGQAVSASSSNSRSVSATRSVNGTDARARRRRSSVASRRIRAKPAGE